MEYGLIGNKSMKKLVMVVCFLLVAGSAWGKECPEGFSWYWFNHDDGMCMKAVSSPPLISTKEEIMPECYWEVTTLYIHLSSGVEIQNWLKNHPEWEPFGAIHGSIYLKRKVCK